MQKIQNLKISCLNNLRKRFIDSFFLYLLFWDKFKCFVTKQSIAQVTHHMWLTKRASLSEEGFKLLILEVHLDTNEEQVFTFGKIFEIFSFLNFQSLQKGGHISSEMGSQVGR